MRSGAQNESFALHYNKMARVVREEGDLMKKNRYMIFAYGLIFAFVLAACGSPTPVVIVVTATSLPPTDAPLVEPTLTLAPVALSGPQSGATMTWIDGSTLIYIPPSEFTMGNNGFDAPVHAVTLDGYWMQQTEVTNRMFAQCVAVGSCSTPTQELGGLVYSNPQFANHPVVGVTWDQAQAYCTWAQGSLPTEAQWEKAARGIEGNIYPWGIESPACELLNFAFCNGSTSEVDSYKNSASPYGLYDMAGNVFEWVSDWYGEAYYTNAPSVNPTGPDSGEFRSIRGSSFETYPDQVDSAIRHFGGQTYHNRDVGFRCAVPTPQPYAPYCQLSAFIPSGAISAEGCQFPNAEVVANYCSVGFGFATVDIPAGSVYEISDKLTCSEAVVDGQRRLTCYGPKAQESTNEITVCNPACSNSPVVTGAGPTCAPGYVLDSVSGLCNYAPIIGQVSVAGCPIGYVLMDRGGQQTCVLGADANGQCSAGLYFDSLAGMCVPPNGLVEAPYGIDNPTLASQSYAGCAPGYSYSDTFQCCQAATGGTYPGCSPGSTFNVDLGACSPGEVRLSGPGCVTLDVTTNKCSDPIDVCSKIKGETQCIRNPACVYNEKADTCDMRP